MPYTSLSLPHKKIGVAVIRNDRDEILIDRRKKTGEMGGLWEFPGGKVEPNETITDCIKREIKEELDIDIVVKKNITTIEHLYPKFKVTLFVYECEYIAGTIKAIECDEFRWVKLDELKSYKFPEANYEIIDILLKQNK